MLDSIKILVLTLVLTGPQLLWGQAVDVTDETKVRDSSSAVGQDAARKYFGHRQAQESGSQGSSLAGVAGDRYLSLHLGSYFSEDVYKWGQSKKSDTGQILAGLSYKFGEWTGSMDAMFKFDISTYSLVEGRATKFSFMPAILFPDADSGFPLYFGAGAGLGVFFKQIEDESSFAFDYSLFAGARFYDVIGTTGFIVETGMKNHILLTSDGQYNGLYLALGGVWRF